MKARAQWTLGTLAALCAGCTLGGTIDNIPKKDPVRLTEVKVRPPVGACPDREAQVGMCRLSDIQCAYDEKGCEVCVCEAH